MCQFHDVVAGSERDLRQNGYQRKTRADMGLIFSTRAFRTRIRSSISLSLSVQSFTSPLPVVCQRLFPNLFGSYSRLSRPSWPLLVAVTTIVSSDLLPPILSSVFSATLNTNVGHIRHTFANREECSGTKKIVLDVSYRSFSRLYSSG